MERKRGPPGAKAMPFPRGAFLDEDGDAVEGEEFYSELLPGRCIGVRYRDEPYWYQERLLLWPCQGRRSWWCYAPDGDLEEEKVTVAHGTTAVQFVALSDEATSLPFMDGRFYRFARYPGFAEFHGLLARARAADRAAHPATTEEKVTRMVLPSGVGGPRPKDVPEPVAARRGTGVKPDAPVMRAGAEAILAQAILAHDTRMAGADVDASDDGATATAAVRNRVQAGTDAEVGDDLWLLAETGPFGTAGTAIGLESGDVVVDAKHALAVWDNVCARLVRVPRGGVCAFLDELALAGGTEGHACDDGGATAAQDPSAASASSAPGPEPSAGLGTFWVDFDSRSKRYSEWRKAVEEMQAEVFEPLWGPISVLDLYGYMRRNGGDPHLWITARPLGARLGGRSGDATGSGGGGADQSAGAAAAGGGGAVTAAGTQRSRRLRRLLAAPAAGLP